jgi:ABC-type cobalamin/Fe3+-siderophores transport system ATPase subunit
VTNNICLYGPPGIGKSTWIKKLQKKGYTAFDFETIWSNQEQVEKKISEFNRGLYSGYILGMAGIDPKREFNCQKILLVLSQSQYDARRAERDKAEPEKATQQIHTIAAWRKLIKWSLILRADAASLNFLENLK